MLDEEKLLKELEENIPDWKTHIPVLEEKYGRDVAKIYYSKDIASVFVDFFNKNGDSIKNSVDLKRGFFGIEDAISYFFDPVIMKKEKYIISKTEEVPRILSFRPVRERLWEIGFPSTEIFEKYVLKNGKKELIEKNVFLWFHNKMVPFSQNYRRQCVGLHVERLDFFSSELDGWDVVYSTMPKPIMNKCISCFDQIFELDVDAGLKFISNAGTLIYYSKYEEPELKYLYGGYKGIPTIYYSNLEENDVQRLPDDVIDIWSDYGNPYAEEGYHEGVKLMEIYKDCIIALIKKEKPTECIYFKPEGLLARMLDHKTLDLDLYRSTIKSLKNLVFLNYLYEGRLPAYSWSASSGEEMMRALTTGEYKENYNSEKKLINRAVRDIGEKYG